VIVNTQIKFAMIIDNFLQSLIAVIGGIAISNFICTIIIALKVKELCKKNNIEW
jgi:hypothetical protein